MTETNPFGNYIPQHTKYLILGSFPAIGALSGESGCTWYYSSKVNQFWPIGMHQVVFRKLRDPVDEDRLDNLFDLLLPRTPGFWLLRNGLCVRLRNLRSDPEDTRELTFESLCVRLFTRRTRTGEAQTRQAVLIWQQHAMVQYGLPGLFQVRQI